MTAADIESSFSTVSPRGLSVDRLERLLFWVSVAAGAGMMWLAPRLPMTDLPQHAAQIALWRDLLEGTSNWSHLVYINLLTPYLIGYGLALPLSLFFSVETAVRIVLTATFLAFVAGCIGLRRELGSDKRLDWLFLPGFFGFSWKWGFLTFLTAAPVFLCFLFLALRYRKAPNLARGAGLVAVGVALLFSHGLMFLFGMLTAGLLLLGPLKEPWKTRLARLTPLIVLTVALAAFALVTSERGTAAHYSQWAMGEPIWMRPLAALVFTSGVNMNGALGLIGLAMVAMASPFFLGRWGNGGAAAALGFGLAGVVLFLPSFAFQTGFLWERFVLFLLPFFAFQFREPPAGGAVTSAMEALGRIALISACLAILAIQASRIFAFGTESRPFERVLDEAKPGQRALGLIFDMNSPSAENDWVYAHFPAWYQADRHGFVDFNFASFSPQVVRFRSGKTPVITGKFHLHLDGFDWRKDQAWNYDYFFIRGDASRVDWLKARSPCKLSLAAADAPWFLVRRDSCP